MKIKSRITVRSEEEAINNAIKQGLMKDSNNHKYLYSKLYKLDNEWHDIFFFFKPVSTILSVTFAMSSTIN